MSIVPRTRARRPIRAIASMMRPVPAASGGRRRGMLRALALAGALAALLSARGSAAAQEPFTLGEVRCAAGTRCRTALTVPAVRGDTAVQLPVTVLHGARPGPVLAVTAGVHGGEYAPMIASQRVAGTVDPLHLSGTLVIVHVTNPVSLYGRAVYYTPADGRNLNRTFPGRADGTWSERAAHVVFTQVIRRADAYLDLHGGDANEALRPYVATRVTGDSAYDARVRALAAATGLELLLETPVPSPVPDPPGTTTMTAAVHRIVGFTVEWGMLGRVDSAAVAGQARAVLGVARALGMLAGAPPRGARVRLAGSRTAVAPVSGLVRVEVSLDQRVREGERVATIIDLHGAPLAPVLAPATGRVISFTATPPVKAGEPVMAVGIPAAR